MKVLMFDLGGVLVEIKGLENLLELSNLSEEKFWEKFLLSPNVHNVETGKISMDVFAPRFIKEFDLLIDVNDFINIFSNLPHRKYSGVDKMLKELSKDFTLACLSNTSDVTADRLLHNFKFESLFDYCFFSSEICISKPSKEAFLYAADQMKCDFDEIMFFDDNKLNVDTAFKLGIEAYTVKGFEELRVYLDELDIYKL